MEATEASVEATEASVETTEGYPPPPLKAKKSASAAGNAWDFDFARMSLYYQHLELPGTPPDAESRPASI